MDMASHAQLMDLTSTERAHLARVHESGVAALETGKLSKLVDALTDGLRDMAAADVAMMHIVEAESGELRLMHHGAGVLARLCAPGGELYRVYAVAAQRGERVFVEDVRAPAAHSSHSRRALLQDGIQAWQAIPLLARNGAVLAVASLYFDRPRRLSDSQLRAVELLARHAADFIDHARQRQALEDRCAREEAARVQAEAANLRKDQFLATIAHEIRQPLAAALPAFEVQKASLDPASRQRASDVIGQQLAHIAKLVDDLSDVGHIGRGTLELHCERLDLRAPVQDAIEMTKPLFVARRHTFDALLGDEPAWVDADATRIRQVFSNLLRNAAWYTPHCGHIRVALAIDTSHVVCRVADNGVGIAPDALTRGFDLFERGVRAGDAGSSGIGLAVVRQVIDLHRGTVSASSEGPGRGSEFTVRLHRAAPPLAHA
jgi:signal transduction histidine kinase